MSQINSRLIVVSNRLPVAIYQDGNDWKVKSSPGGLVTALAPTMRKAHGVWIGWPGCSPDAPADELLTKEVGYDYDLRAVMLTREEIARYYSGFANRSLWPLFHDLLGQFSFNTENWLAYIDVNRRFAEVVARQLENDPDQDSVVWVHDYQLMLVGKFLREMGIKVPVYFFLHIPFPSPDLFRRMPVNRELLRALLEYDHVGLQTAPDRRNFVQCVKWLSPQSRRESFRRRSYIRHEGRRIAVGYYPISIDFREFNDFAGDPKVAEASWYLHENVGNRTLMLGLDRLDYTKGIPERFLAFERALERHEELIGKISLIQIVVPSRLNVSEYQQLKDDLDFMAGRINSRFSRHGWTPIHYEFRELDRVQLAAHYRACEIALVTPLRDGMNLVSKEYCASQIEYKGVLILSEFAGAARQLHKGAIVVNPYDIDATADAIYEAYIMPSEERARRMQLLRDEVRKADVKRWVKWFLSGEAPRRESTEREEDGVEEEEKEKEKETVVSESEST